MKHFAILLFSLFTVFASQAHAGVEIRGHFGKWMTEPKDFNDAIQGLTGNLGVAKLPAPAMLGADAVYVMPIMPLVFGARYEMISMKADSTFGGSSFNQKFDGSRVSLLGGYRLFHNPLFFVGPLAHLGVSQKGDFSLTQGSTTTKYKGTVDTSYGLGVEGGFTFGAFLLGAELGYTKFKVKSFNDPTTGTDLFDVNNKIVTMDLSGTYFMLSLGASF